MSSPDKIKAIVLSYDRHRAMTDHMILQYARLWPDHPFVFVVPYQTLQRPDTERVNYVKAPGGKPSDIPFTILELIANLDDEELVYWCSDDKYPIQLLTGKIASLMTHARRSPQISGLMFCRCRATLGNPELTLYPGEWITPAGDVLLERRAWYQFWIHQFVRVKVLRHYFSELPDDLPSAESMDGFREEIVKLADHRLFVTKKNFAVFGESTQQGVITQNCYESIIRTDIELPDWFRRPTGEYVTLGKL
jgi:hypothetical protein